jgi:hypothetical protein
MLVLKGKISAAQQGIRPGSIKISIETGFVKLPA